MGSQIVQLVPGVISTEVDARLSFDTDQTIAKAESLIDQYAKVGIDSSRVLIKIASTWEGIRAAAELEKRGIHCNLTYSLALSRREPALMRCVPDFSVCGSYHGLVQGEYRHQHRQPRTRSGRAIGTAHLHPLQNAWIRDRRYGCQLPQYRSNRSAGGCDRLTIAPDLLNELGQSDGELPRALVARANEKPLQRPLQKLSFGLSTTECNGE